MTTTRAHKIVINLIIVASFIYPVFAQKAAPQAVSGRLIEVKLPSPSLKGNLLGDPVEQSVAIYLPPGYDTSASKRYPTLYLLHGFGGDSKTWTGKGDFGFNVLPLLDAMMSDGRIRELIVVAPNGRNAYGGSFYSNSEVTGNWEDYIYRDLVGYVDAHYRTFARSSSRGIAGHSMGGYGAVILGMKHPETFSAVYALSPCCLGLEGDLGETNSAWLRVLRLTSRNQVPKEPKSFEDFFVTAFVALSAVFSPNQERPPLYGDLPFLEVEGRIQKNDVVYNKWKSKMPLYLVERYKQNLLSLRGIFLDYGEKEEFSHIRSSTSSLSKALAERQIPHVFELYKDGDHGNKVRERLETRLFGFFSDKLDFSNP